MKGLMSSLMTRRFRSLAVALRLVLGAATVAAAPACTGMGDTSPGPVANAVFPFHVTFSAGALVTTLVVTVTGPGIAVPLVFNMPIVAGTASGTITVPVGSGRLIAAQAFDSSGAVLFSGSTTITVSTGANPPVSFTLAPLVGTVPVTAVVGAVTISLLPTSATVRAGLTTTLVPTVRDALGVVVPGAIVIFATNSPPVAWGATGGIVTGLDAGTATVTATSLGAAAAATITVTAGTSLDFLTLAPATASAAAGTTVTIAITARDASTPGIDSTIATLSHPSTGSRTCTARAPSSGTRNAGAFTCTIVYAPGLATGTYTPTGLTIFWGGPPGSGGGSTAFTPELLNARGVTAAVTVTP